MTVTEQIESYLGSQPEPKLGDMQALHCLILQIAPASPLWFLDGKNNAGKVVCNPSIGYGHQNLKYADGKTKDFYQIGISANKTGISVYILGIEDKGYLARTFAGRLGKASVSSYCIKLKKLSDIPIDTLESAIRIGFDNQGPNS